MRIQESNMVSDALEEYTKEIQRRKTKEAIAAWRAGYDYLHNYIEEPEVENLTLSIVALPTNNEVPTDFEGYTYTGSYVLTDLNREDVRIYWEWVQKQRGELS